MKQLTAVVIGYGGRGHTYAAFSVNFPDMVKIVAVAEPVLSKREHAKKRFALSEDMCFTDWREVAEPEVPRLADFAIIATQDEMHYEPALALIEKGYNLLLEKPMAPNARECKLIYEAAAKKGVKVIVCHVLRFTKFYKKLKEIITSDEIGDVVSIVHMENVGNVHQSHSFVRGNWRKKSESAPMILAKSCHDADLLQWLLDKKCKKVQSFGSLVHFTKENKPEGAPARCIDGCPHAESCYYNAVKLYYDDKNNNWFRSIAADKPDPTDEDVLEAIKTGPYGRCVYECDNDVVDHQVVNMEFEGGVTVSFSMNAFNEGGRFMRIFGTKGEAYANMKNNTITVYSFATRKTTIYELDKIGDDITAGHGGGDTGIMIELSKYFNDEPVSNSICTLETSYLNHLICFAAEDARLSGTVIDMDEYEENIK